MFYSLEIGWICTSTPTCLIFNRIVLLEKNEIYKTIETNICKIFQFFLYNFVTTFCLLLFPFSTPPDCCLFWYFPKYEMCLQTICMYNFFNKNHKCTPFKQAKSYYYHCSKSSKVFIIEELKFVWYVCSMHPILQEYLTQKHGPHLLGFSEFNYKKPIKGV